ncbi:MAG: hypothetical protein M3O20_16005 [Acidobacteriota bacterium]|nr:hypothetical protein [Acidobacteriota bacterium]
MKPPGLTRRALALYAAPALLASPAKPQAPPAPASGKFQSAAQQLAAVKLARNIEPATRFEA